MVSRKKGWTKDSDWLPLSNAKAIVKFWEKDLEYAEKYLKYVQSFQKYGFKFYEKILDNALLDIELSKVALVKAKAKLKESEDLE